MDYITSTLLSMLLIFISVNGVEKQKDLIYIYMATMENAYIPFVNMPMERYTFIQSNCFYQNCYTASVQEELNDVTDFDVVVFNAVNIKKDLTIGIPEKRSPRQRYVLASIEPSMYYSIEQQYDNFFNWTWTYKLNSDVTSPYLIAKDRRGNVVAPQLNTHWMDTKKMKRTSKYILNKLKNKNKAAVWFVSHCNAVSNRTTFVQNLAVELNKYGHKIDIFGHCNAALPCTKDFIDECYAMVESDYYFYLSFENSFGEDYVSEKLLVPLKHYAVPIVYGGANYTRFLPDGIYLDARKLGYRKLARKMNALINDKEKYYEFFKWHGYYSFHEPGEFPETNIFCKFCEFLNKEVPQNTTKIYHDIVRWFNEPADWPTPPPPAKPTVYTDTGHNFVNVFKDLYAYVFED